MSDEVNDHEMIDENSLINQELYRVFVTQSSEAIWRIEMDEPVSVGLSTDEQIELFYQYTFLAECNDAMAKMYGFDSAAEIIGRRLGDFLVREDESNIEYLRAFVNSNYRLENAESHEVDRAGQPKVFLNNLIGIIEKGCLTRAWGTQRDITERRESEKSKAHLAAIVESSDDVIISKNLDGIILSWNKGAEMTFGYTAEEAIGKSVTMLIPPALRNQETEILDRIKRGEAIENFETARRRKDGTEIDVSLTVSPIKNDAGKIIGASKIARDITESKRAEESLRESQAILALSMQSSRMGVWTLDFATDTVWWSEELEEIFGLEKDAFGGSEKEFFDLVHEDDREESWGEIQQAIAEHRDYTIEFRFRHTDGSLRWMEGRGKAVYSEKGAPVRLYGIGIDITDRKKSEEKLRESEERYRTLFDSIDEGFCVFEMLFDASGKPFDYRFLEINPAFEDLTGLKNAVGKTAREMIPGLEKHWFEIYGKVALTGESIRFTEGSDVMSRWFDVYAVRVGGEESRKVALIFNNITEHKKSEESLRESEEKFSKAFNSSPLVLTITALKDGKLIEVNDTFVQVTGYARAETIGRTTAELGLWENPADREAELAAVQKMGELRDLEFNFRLKDGREIVGLLSAELLEIRGEPCALTVIQDITGRKKAEAISERYRLLSMRARDIILFFRANGQIVDANQAAVKTYGYELADLLKKRIHDLRAPETLAVLEEQLKQANESGLQWETIHLRKDGTKFPVEVTSVGADIGGERLLISIIRDTTDRRQGQEALLKAERRASEEYLELLSRIVPVAQTLGTARDLTSIYRALHEFVRASMPCTAFFVSSYNAEKCLRVAEYAWGADGEVDISVLPPMALTEDGGPNSQAIFQKKSVVVNRYWDLMKTRPHVVLQEDGNEPNSSLVVPMTVMNRIIGTLEVQAYEDDAFTKEHIVALEMVGNLAAVAIENVRLLQVEADARETAEAANRAKDEFLSVLSHELRTPLNSILGWVRMLRAGVLDQEKTGKAVEVIERNALLQNNLIEDLLDVSRIISGKMRIEKETVDLVKIFNDAVEILRPAAAQKNILFETAAIENSLTIEGDAMRFQQIIVNLVQNAVKFTFEGGKVEVSLSRRGDFARLVVKDNGIGIGEDLLPYVFERFRQADSSTKRAFSGLGLGLTIVRNLVELHGGTISAESEGENRGASFIVEIPLTKDFLQSADSSGDVKVSSGEHFALQGARILLVDDDAESVIPLQLFLEKEKAEIVTATSAQAALEKLSQESFDVLITDIGMPRADGYDLIARVRQLQTEQNAFISAIALTAYASADDRRRALASGFQEHFAKPVNYDELLTVVKRIYDEGRK